MSVEAAKQNVPGHQAKLPADPVPAKASKEAMDGTPDLTAKEILDEQKPSHRRQESSTSMLDKGPSSVGSDSGVLDVPLTPQGESGELKEIQSLDCNGNQEKKTSQKSSTSESFASAQGQFSHLRWLIWRERKENEEKGCNGREYERHTY